MHELVNMPHGVILPSDTVFWLPSPLLMFTAACLLVATIFMLFGIYRHHRTYRLRNQALKDLQTSGRRGRSAPF